jgi:hypothetical protein
MIRVSGSVFVSAEGQTLEAAIAAFREMFDGLSPEEWEETEAPEMGTEPDGGNIVAWCEGCGRPICDDEEYAHGEDADLCPDCYPEPLPAPPEAPHHE